MLQIYFKRAKSFVAEVNGGTRKFLAQPALAAQPCPNWIAHTETFKRGIKDGSIVNLTPVPLPAPVVEPEPEPNKAAVVGETIPTAAVGVERITIDEAEDEGKLQSVQSNIDDADKQEAVPSVPFGGQPNTPVPPAPHVGGVRASTKRTGK